MLHYSVDHELMSDLYRDYRQIKGAEYEQIHALGEHYLAIAQDYDLADSTMKSIQGQMKSWKAWRPELFMAISQQRRL